MTPGTRCRIVVLFLCALVAQGCNRPTPGNIMSLPATGSVPEAIDIAVITVIPEEYEAFVGKLSAPLPLPVCAGCTNRYAWVTAEVQSGARKNPLRIAVGMIGEPGLTAGALATQRAIERFRPRYILLVGIAGGIPERVHRGDVVVANAVWNYDYGSLDRTFTPRLDFTYRPDEALLQAALALDAPWQKEIRTPAPEPVSPVRRSGSNASGYKVVETLATEFIDRVLQRDPAIVSIEMEGAGAAAAVEEAREQGVDVGLLMIRGISDIPQPRGKPLLGDKPDREKWKAYAADAAASFALTLIRSGWPAAVQGRREGARGS